MGLVLSGQGEKTSPLLKVARQYSGYLSYPLIIASIVWLLLMPLEHFSREAYFSENAMMPAQVETTFGTNSHIEAMGRIDTALISHSEHDYKERQAHALLTVFEEIGLDSEIQRFVYDEVPGVGEHRGINVHGILRASRSDSVESLLIAAPWRTSDNKTNINAIRLMAGLAKYAAEQVYWAKDVIFVVTDSGEQGIETWLRAYHGESGMQPLFVRSGIIQAAMSLELPPAKHYSGMGLYFEGKTGQLPNLDFINIVQYISQLERMPAYLHGMADAPVSADWLEKYARSAELLLRQVRSQAIGSSVGVHAPFLRYRIDALTLSGIAKASDEIAQASESLAVGELPGMPHPYVIRSVGRTIESTMRSLNNLLEHFHQSFFFYILPANEKYISIGDYIPAVGLMVASLLVQAMQLWWMQGTDDMRADDPKARIERMNKYYTFLRRTLASNVGIILRVHALGLLLFITPQVIPHAVLTNTTSTAYVFTMGLASSSMVLHIADIYYEAPMHRLVDWRQLKALVELYVAVVIACLSVMNFSLAVVAFAVAGLPLVLTRAYPRNTRAMRILSICVLIATSPACVLTLSRGALGLHPWDFTSSPFRMFLGDFHHYSGLTYPLICLVYWPVNLLCMVITMLP